MADSKLIRQGGVAIGYMDKDGAILDEAFLGCEIGRRLIRSGTSVRWRAGIAQELEQAAKEQRKIRKVRIHQLRPEVDPAKKFISSEELYQRFGGIEHSEYAVVFDGQLDTDVLEAIYERFNAQTLPKGYHGHRLTVSDVVELYDEDGESFWYLNTDGFEAIDLMKGASE